MARLTWKSYTTPWQQPSEHPAPPREIQTSITTTTRGRLANRWWKRALSHELASNQNKNIWSESGGHLACQCLRNKIVCLCSQDENRLFGGLPTQASQNAKTAMACKSEEEGVLERVFTNLFVSRNKIVIMLNNDRSLPPLFTLSSHYGCNLRATKMRSCMTVSCGKRRVHWAWLLDNYL